MPAENLTRIHHIGMLWGAHERRYERFLWRALGTLASAELEPERMLLLQRARLTIACSMGRRLGIDGFGVVRSEAEQRGVSHNG